MNSVRNVSWGTVIVLCFVPMISAEHLDMTSPDELSAALERIATGYEKNIQSVGPLKIQGRIFNVQGAREGYEVAENAIFPAEWLDFTYIQKDGKRRYEQDQALDTDRGVRSYTLDNNKRLFIYAGNVVRIFPLTDEEKRWNQANGFQNDFTMLRGVDGEENVGAAMRSYITRIQEALAGGRGWDMAVDMDDDALIKLTIGGGSQTLREFTIDSSKGFNLINRVMRTVNPTQEHPRGSETEYEYIQLANGAWILSKARFTYSGHNNVVGERRYELDEVVTDIDEIPDSLFEAESLGIPANIRTVDYSVSPPLERRFGDPVPKSLVGEPVGDFTSLGLELDADTLKDRPVLVVFFDLEQRPSRNALMELKAMQATLEGKGLIVVGVQASKTEKAALDQWLSDQDIRLPVGMIAENEVQTRAAWAVQSLPWLLMTDAEHRVLAEGFPVAGIEGLIE